MASKTTINDAQAPISKCEVCDRGVVAWFYCHECKQEMCKDCKTMHLRMNISKDHTVVCITRDKKNVGEKGQSNIPCSIHPCEHIQMFCTTCEMPVCIICIADRTHKNHEFDQLVNAKEKYKNELSKFVTKTKQEILNLETSLQSMQNHVKDYIKLSDKTKSDINRQRNEMKSQVDKIADDLIDEQEKRTIQEMKIMDSKTKEIQKILSEKIDLLRSCEDNVESGIETVIDITKDFRKKRIKLTTLSSIEAYSLPGFDSGNTSDLRKIFGELKDYEGSMSNKNISGDEEQREKSEDRLQSNSIPKVLAKIKLRPPLNTVFSLNGREAWCGQDKDLSLIQIDGSVKKNVKFDKNMYDITTRSTGDLLVTERWGHSIKQYSLDGTITTIDVPTLFEVRGLCTTADDHILICLYNDKDVSKVAKMSFEGQIKKFFKFNKLNKPLFCNPQLVAENMNGDVCVVDDYCSVVIIDKDGQLRCKYPVSDKSTNNHGYCYGIACDKLGNVLISDMDNNRIHQLDKDGNFVQFVLTKLDGIFRPYGLSIDKKGQLWVCNDSGNEVRVYKYRS